jgi:putative membrane protein
MPRLFIYNTEAQEKDEVSRGVLQEQFVIMMRRLWYGITVPSAFITLILGLALMIKGGWHKTLFHEEGRWLLVKLIFVFLLYGYFHSLHRIFKAQMSGVFKFTSMQLRILNEAATVFLFAIVFLAVVKTSMSWLAGLVGLIILILLLMLGIKVYKSIREKN